MIRVYLDTNVFTQENLSDDEFIRFKNALLSKKDIFLYVYSKAHLLDLLRDTTNKKEGDLDFLERLADNHYITTEGELNNCAFINIFPKEAFETKINHEYYSNLNFSNSLFGSEILKNFPQLNELFNMKFNWGIGEISKIPEEHKDFLGKIIPISNDGVSLNEWFQHFEKSYNNWGSKESKEYREIRKYTKDILNLDIDVSSSKFDQLLKQTPLKKSFTELIEYVISINKSLKSSRYQHFISAFIMLNLFGLDKEKNKKSRFSNTNHDSQHSFYAAHCDILVTADKSMAIKSKALYNLWGIQTKVYPKEEFLNIISSITMDEEISVNRFFELLKNELKYGIVIDRIPKIEDETVYEITKPSYRFLGYFNRIQKSTHTRDGIYLLNKPKNYSTIILHDEIKAVINKAIKLFGLDIEKRGDFQPNELEEMQNDAWTGRHWLIDKKFVNRIGYEKISNLLFLHIESFDSWKLKYEESKKIIIR